MQRKELVIFEIQRQAMETMEENYILRFLNWIVTELRLRSYSRANIDWYFWTFNSSVLSNIQIDGIILLKRLYLPSEYIRGP